VKSPEKSRPEAQSMRRKAQDLQYYRTIKPCLPLVSKTPDTSHTN
jgi:hypothetical protein